MIASSAAADGTSYGTGMLCAQPEPAATADKMSRPITSADKQHSRDGKHVLYGRTVAIPPLLCPSLAAVSPSGGMLPARPTMTQSPIGKEL